MEKKNTFIHNEDEIDAKNNQSKKEKPGKPKTYEQ